VNSNLTKPETRLYYHRHHHHHNHHHHIWHSFAMEMTKVRMNGLKAKLSQSQVRRLNMQTVIQNKVHNGRVVFNDINKLKCEGGENSNGTAVMAHFVNISKRMRHAHGTSSRPIYMISMLKSGEWAPSNMRRREVIFRGLVSRSA
jgi:hypothetical protein